MYRTIQTDIWGDPWFVDLPPERKLLFIHLFTNRNVTACGSMQLSTSQIAFETKLSVKKVERELEALGDKILWLPAHNLIIVRNFYRHQRSKSSENFTVAAKKVIPTLPEEARAWLGDVYPELKEGMDTPKDTHPQPIPNPSPTQGDKEEVTVTATVEATETETGDTPQPPKGEVIPPEFAEFWERYPTGFGSKPKSLAAWKKVRKEHAAIMAGLESWHRSERWINGFIKASELWLRDRLWENPPPPPKNAPIDLPEGVKISDLLEARARKAIHAWVPPERLELLERFGDRLPPMAGG